MLIDINKNLEVINEYVEDKEVYSTKIIDFLPSDINEYQYSYIDGKLVRGNQIDFKKYKLQELEQFIYNLKEEGVIYNELPFKCDDLASSRINKVVTGISIGANPFPLTWITRNSEQGVIVFNTKEEFIDFYTTFSNYELQLQIKEATLKMQIELATTKEELDNIVFE